MSEIFSHFVSTFLKHQIILQKYQIYIKVEQKASKYSNKKK